MKKVPISVAIFVFILISACTNPFGPQQTPAARPELYTGTEGISASIIEHTPQAYEDQPFRMSVYLHNKGTHTLTGSEQGVYTLIYEHQYIEVQNVQYSGTGSASTYQLEGKTLANPYGQENRINYMLRTKNLPPQSQHYTTDLIFQTCYPYKTTATIPVCIDTDLQETPNQVCEAGTQTHPEGQGAPVAVTEVNTIMIPRTTTTEKAFTPRERADIQHARIPGETVPETYSETSTYVQPLFEITLENLGGGQVLRSGTARDFCQGTQEPRNMNIINVTVQLQDRPLDCQSPIRMTPGQTLVRCRGDLLTPGAAYTSQIEIELTYDYATTAATTLDIQQT